MKQRTFLSPTLWMSLLLVILASCKRDQEPAPTPQMEIVSIDDKVYPTKTIGNQVWTTANYEGPGGLPFQTGKERPEYGRYYTLAEAKAVSLPSGWRLPTMQDFITLAESQGVVFTAYRATNQTASAKLVSNTNWRATPGTNSSGFNAYPAGYMYQNIQPTDGDMSEFWTSDGNTFSIQEGAGKAHNILFYNSNEAGYRFTVRFVKDR